MKAIVNLSTSKYLKGQQRLVSSIINHTDADIFSFINESEVGAPSHRANNYAFKVFAIEKARSNGYKQVLWLDASMYVIKDLKPIFDLIEQDGYFFQDSGWLNSTWTNDRAKDYFGNADGIMLSSGVLGLNFENSIACDFFDLWKKSMLDGIFNGSHDNHRHDQTCASIIAHKLNMKLQEGNSFFVYGVAGEEPINKNSLIIAHGIC